MEVHGPVRRPVEVMLTTAVWFLCVSCSGAQIEGSSLKALAAARVQPAGGQAGAPAAPGEATPPGTSESAPAGQPSRIPSRLALTDAFRLALEANKDVLVAAYGADAAEARIWGAKGEFDPTVFAQATRGRSNLPVAGVPLTETDTSEGGISAGVRQRVVTGTDVELTASTSYMRDLTGASALNPQHTSGLSLSVTQDLLRNFGIGINRTNILIAQNNWEISKEDLRSTIIENLFEVENAYWELYFAIADLKVRQVQQERANKLVQRAEAQVKVGEAAPIDVTRAKSSAATQAVAILDARNQIIKLRHRLLRVMGILDPELAGTEFELADAPPGAVSQVSLAEALDTALKSRPDYVQASLAVDNAELQRRFARNQRLPKLQLFGDVSVVGLDDEFGSSVDMAERGDFNTWEVGLLFEWPVPNRTARANYRVAQLEHLRAKVRLNALTEQVTREVADALADLQTAEGRIASASEAHDLAERLLQAEEKSFSLGRSNSVDVLIAQEGAASAERDVVRARADYANALAGLLRVQGNLLEARGIGFVQPPRE